jgi:hypothetical protein
MIQIEKRDIIDQSILEIKNLMIKCAEKAPYSGSVFLKTRDFIIRAFKVDFLDPESIKIFSDVIPATCPTTLDDLWPKITLTEVAFNLIKSQQTQAN